MDNKVDLKFQNLEPLKEKAFLSSPTMHGKEIKFIMEAYESNWMTTVGENIDSLEDMVARYLGVNHAVALSSGTFS